MKLPRYIGLCGNPRVGKSLVQSILKDHYNVQPVDDGEALRVMAMQHFGAKRSDVYTQEGKASLAYWPNGDPIIDHRNGEQMTWRQVLGRLGKQLEALIGPYVMPMMACAGLPAKGGPYSFGSVRMTQGEFYKKHGGVIIGVRSPGVGPSENDFDWFDPDLVDLWIDNDALFKGMSHAEALVDLTNKIVTLVESYKALKAGVMPDLEDCLQVRLDDTLVGVIRTVDGATASKYVRLHFELQQIQIMLEVKRCSYFIDRLHEISNGPKWVEHELRNAGVPNYAIIDADFTRDATVHSWLAVCLISATDMNLYERLFDHPDFEPIDFGSPDLDMLAMRETEQFKMNWLYGTTVLRNSPFFNLDYTS